jgi:hypothetical protein
MPGQRVFPRTVIVLQLAPLTQRRHFLSAEAPRGARRAHIWNRFQLGVFGRCASLFLRRRAQIALHRRRADLQRRRDLRYGTSLIVQCPHLYRHRFRHFLRRGRNRHFVFRRSGRRRCSRFRLSLFDRWCRCASARYCRSSYGDRHCPLPP